MKQYHTSIIINCSREVLWKELTNFKVYSEWNPIVRELTWQGSQGAKWLMAGRHYYKLEKISDSQTKLYHGEYFTGLFSFLISNRVLEKMRAAFLNHNQLLKQRIENGKE